MLKQRILEKMSEGELDSQVKGLQKKFHGFLNEEGALNLIASRQGLVKEEKPFTLTKIKDFKIGETVSFNAVLLSALSPRQFNVNDRKGFVLNAKLADESGNVALVLWNKDAFSLNEFERGSFLLVKDAFVKQLGEVHSRLTTQILSGEKTSLFPKPAVKSLSLSQCTGLLNFDVCGRILEKSDLKEFNRNDKPGKLCKALLADESGQLNAVFWNNNAEALNRFNVGDAVKIEGAFEKEGELHVGTDSRVIKASRDLESTEQLFSRLYPTKTLSQASEGDQCIISMEVVRALSLARLFKCSCGKKPLTVDCECGKKATELLVLNLEVSDGLTTTRCVLFNENAKKVLQIRELGIDYSLLFDLKRDYLKNNELKVIAQAKYSKFSNSLEITAKHVLSLKTPYEMPEKTLLQ